MLGSRNILNITEIDAINTPSSKLQAPSSIYAVHKSHESHHITSTEIEIEIEILANCYKVHIPILNPSIHQLKSFFTKLAEPEPEPEPGPGHRKGASTWQSNSDRVGVQLEADEPDSSMIDT